MNGPIFDNSPSYLAQRSASSHADMSALPVKARLMILQAEESAKSAQTIQAMGRFRSWLMVAATVIIAGTFLLSSDFFLRVFM